MNLTGTACFLTIEMDVEAGILLIKAEPNTTKNSPINAFLVFFEIFKKN